MPAPLDVENIPAEMRSERRWVVWRYEGRGHKRTKVPYMAAQPKRRASSTDAGTWDSFDAAIAVHRAGQCVGIGFMLGDGWVGVDLDSAINEAGEIHPSAAQIVARVNSYTEISPSGRGLHIIARGVLPAGGRKKDGIEMYDSARYLTVTGRHVPNTPHTIHERTPQIAALHALMFRKDAEHVAAPERDDSAVFERISAIANGNFARLMAGEWEGTYESQSEADLALVCEFLRCTSDHDQIDRLFRRSGLYRDKWERADYRRRTIREAMDRVQESRAAVDHGAQQANNLAWSLVLDRMNGGAATTSRNGDRFRLISDAEMEAMPKPPFIVGDKLTQGGLSVLVGPPGSGKTFFALGAMCSIASGVPLGNDPVFSTGTGVFIAAEGSSGIGARLRAWKDFHHVDRSLGVHFITEPVALLNPAEADHFLRALASLPAAPVFVVVDTLARCMVGGDENSTQDMSSFIAGADRIRRETGAHVMLLHHLNAGGERERGNTALRGACDTMIFVKSDTAGLTLTCEKQKDATIFAPLYLDLVQCGESCAVTATRGLQSTDASISAKQLSVLRLLQSHFLDEGATASEWLRACENVSDRMFYNYRTSLVRMGYVAAPAKPRGGRYTLTELGKQAVTANCNLTAISLQLQRP